MHDKPSVSVGPPEVTDSLTELLRQRSGAFLARAAEGESVAFLPPADAALDNEGRRRAVRNVYLPERERKRASSGVRARPARS